MSEGHAKGTTDAKRRVAEKNVRVRVAAQVRDDVSPGNCPIKMASTSDPNTPILTMGGSRETREHGKGTMSVSYQPKETRAQ
eukprot:3127842-Heterocapsa_arctica.AAC.1